jgi:predicted permease
VAPGFFATVGTPIVAGRDITWADVDQRRPVAILSENVARETWQHPERAIGKRIRQGTGPWREVIGVVSDVHDEGVHEPAPPIVYWPLLMADFWHQPVHARWTVTFTIRSSRAGSESFVKDIQRAVWQVDAGLPLTNVSTLSALYERSMARTSFTLVMLVIAAALALLLGIVGIYGVIAYAVTQRTREIGIRVALGAPHGQLRRMFMRQGVVLAALGTLCGLTAAIGLTRLMSSLLFGISPLDPATYVAVSMVLIASAALASYIPALRTTSVDPVEALRAE